MTWQPIETAPSNRVIWTKIDDERGERNVQRLRRSNGLWFVPSGDMYVYYTPTHWAPDGPEPPSCDSGSRSQSRDAQRLGPQAGRAASEAGIAQTEPQS